MVSVRACLCDNRGWGTVPLFTYFSQQASADCHCMLAGESRISSNMTIAAFHRTQKLQIYVPQTHLCLILRNKIGLPPANWLISAYSNKTISLSHHFHPL